MLSDQNDDDKTQSFIVLSEGTIVGHYRVISKIGAGGMGEVYLAEDTTLDREVAIKFLPLHLCQDADCRARFTREAKAAAKLDHPNIVPVYEVGDFKGRPFFVMAHIEGKSLREIVKEGKLTIPQAVDFAKQICAGLNEAHNAGIVHRDIKPGNIIIDGKNNARLLDFGLATVSGETKLTKTGSTLGTVGYMSPEQVRGEKADHRSDLFSVGVVLYEMITGRKPFDAEHDAAIHYNIVNEEPEPLSRYKSGVSGELQQIIDKALSKDVSTRYQTAAGMMADLKRMQTDAVRSKKGRLGLWIAVVTAIVIVAGYFGYNQFYKLPDQADAPKRLVVLPFDNTGPDEQTYFASGVNDEIINKLAAIEGLAVVARQSAAKLKQDGLDAADIGKKLGVDYVLDASIHYQASTSGTKHVRLVTRLIEVAEDRVLWGKTYDTVMTEVFALQSDMAKQIADQLGIVLTDEDRAAIWTNYTNSEEAWDYFQQGLNYFQRADRVNDKEFFLALEMFNKTIELDSTFDRAYSEISKIYSQWYFRDYDISDSCKEIARSMAEKAIALSSLRPGSSGGHGALAKYYYQCEHNYEKSIEEWKLAYARMDESNPDYAWYFWHLRNAYRRMGEWDKAYEYGKKTVEMEPMQVDYIYQHAITCRTMKKYSEAEELYKRVMILRPDDANTSTILAWMYIAWQGDTHKARICLDSALKWADTASLLPFLSYLDVFEGRINSARVRGGTHLLPWSNEPELIDKGLEAWIYDQENKKDSAYVYWDSLRLDIEAALKQAPNNYNYYSMLGQIYAKLGNRKLALENARRAIDMMPVSVDALRGPDFIESLMECFVNLGEIDSALILMEKLLTEPSSFDLGYVFVHPDFKEVLNHPGFVSLVREYGNEYHKRLYEERVGPL